MSLAQIREAIAELTAAERLELSVWLTEETANSTLESKEGDEELRLAHDRLAELASGTKKALPEEEFWARMNAFKASLK
jgi:hypothetical protein